MTITGKIFECKKQVRALRHLIKTLDTEIGADRATVKWHSNKIATPKTKSFMASAYKRISENKTQKDQSMVRLEAYQALLGKLEYSGHQIQHTLINIINNNQ